jgi:hypothetical protein
MLILDIGLFTASAILVTITTFREFKKKRNKRWLTAVAFILLAAALAIGVIQ